MKLEQERGKTALSRRALNPDKPMIWSTQLSQLSLMRDEGKSVSQCATQYGVRYGTMAAVFSRYGIASLEEQRLEKDRRLARKFAGWGWSVNEIAEQLHRSECFVRKALKAQAVAGIQLALWSNELFRIPAPLLIVVPKDRKRKSAQQCVQLSLFDGDQQLMAA